MYLGVVVNCPNLLGDGVQYGGEEVFWELLTAMSIKVLYIVLTVVAVDRNGNQKFLQQ